MQSAQLLSITQRGAGAMQALPDNGTTGSGTAGAEMTYEVDFPEGGLMRKLHGNANEYWVNSVHHQGIKQLPEILDGLAYSVEDQIVEAIHLKKDEPGRVMGVQWHPEFFKHHPDALINPDKVYQHFLSFC